MIDINKIEELEKLRKAFNSPSGSMVVKYITQELESKFDYSKINVERDNSVVGEDFKVCQKAKKAIDDILEVFNP